MKITAAVQKFRNSSFHMNALYLMLSTVALAGTGFLFWVVISRTYDTESVGIATTLISVSSLISLLGLVGFDAAFVRFLPRSQRRNDYINSGIIIVILASSALSIITAGMLPFTVPHLAILEQPWFFAVFVLFTIITALNVLTNAVFLAYKQARHIFVINLIFGSLRITFPFMMAPMGEAAIFIFAGTAQLVGLILSLLWMRSHFHYRFVPFIDRQAVSLVRKFSASVYVSSVLNLLPPTLIPLVITALLGPENAAYYYMAFTIAGVLYTVAYASMQSVFAEGSHDETSLPVHIKKATQLIGVILLPAAVGVYFASVLLLSVFGEDYSRYAASLLQLFALSAVPVAIYSALGAIFKVTKQLKAVVVMNIVYAVGIVGGSYLFVPFFGLNAIGYAWMFGNIIACLAGGWFVYKKERGPYGTVTNSRRR